MIVTLPTRRRPAPALAVGWCVRMDWPPGADGVATHSLVGFATTHRGAARRLPGLRRSWARGPLRPAGYRVVEISRHDWRLHAHRPRCASPGCPTGVTP
jgi:hypothetical protein